MSWIPPATGVPRYSEWDVETEADWSYLGTTPPAGQPVFSNHQTESIHRATDDDEAERLISEDAPSLELNPEETVRQYLEHIGEVTGWESFLRVRPRAPRGRRGRALTKRVGRQFPQASPRRSVLLPTGRA